MLELAFETREIRTLCERTEEARRVLGDQVADALRRRLADLRAASSVHEIPIGRPRLLDGEDHGRMAVDLRDGYRLVLAPGHPRPPVDADGQPDWARVTRVKVMRIETNYGH